LADVVDVNGKYVYLAARNLVFGSLTRFPFWAALQVISQNLDWCRSRDARVNGSTKV
jgi:hypothetical protein